MSMWIGSANVDVVGLTGPAKVIALAERAHAPLRTKRKHSESEVPQSFPIAVKQRICIT
jgi:hypothetical protein